MSFVLRLGTSVPRQKLVVGKSERASERARERERERERERGGGGKERGGEGGREKGGDEEGRKSRRRGRARDRLVARIGFRTVSNDTGQDATATMMVPGILPPASSFALPASRR